jgi:GntR family transcriptional regulator
MSIAQPLHETIRSWIESEIEKGHLKPDEKLPSENELCAKFGVSRITVRRALQTLESCQLIYRCQGVGSFVGSGKTTQPLVHFTDFMEDMRRAGLKGTSIVVQTTLETAEGDVAERLQVKEGLKVYRLDRLRLGDGEPIAFDITYLPMVYGQLLDGLDLSQRTLFSVFETEYDIVIKGGTIHISGAAATDYLAEHLGIREGQPLLQLNRYAYTVNDKPLYWQKRFYRNDRVSYQIQLERGEAETQQSTTQSSRRTFEDVPIKEIMPVFAKN